jgi:spermidine-citrate ligase
MRSPAPGRPHRRRAADAAVTTLLACFLRETGAPVDVPPGGRLRVRLDHLGVELEAGLRHRSATGYHLFDLPVRVVGSTHPMPAGLGPAALAAVLACEMGAGDLRADLGSLVEAVAESERNMARFLAAAAAASGDGRQPAATPFLRAEQSLLTGHPLHPTSKSRTPMSPEEVAEFSPEMGAAFPLHWFSADPSLVREDSALDLPATALLARLLAADPDVDPEVRRLAARPGDRSLLPAHPWQARRLVERSEVRALLAAGRLTHHGAQGDAWSPTSSVRTVYRADAPVMLKLSLGVRITNSVRLNLRKELARGLEVHRLLEAGLGEELHERFPRFDILRDPAWVTLETGEPGPESGFEVVIRQNPYGGTVEAAPVAALCEPAADGGPSLLARQVQALAAAEGRPVAEVARRWFARYLEIVADPMLWLHGAKGIALEAHQQNGVVELRDRWPAGFRYRDNQGYYIKASRADRLRELLPGLDAESHTVCDDAVADERFGYYLGVNHLLGLIGAFGRAGLVAEEELLDDLARHLSAPDRAFPSSPMVDALLISPRLRCKANLRTRLDDMDELVGPMESQSVYVEIANPLHGRAAVALAGPRR